MIDWFPLTLWLVILGVLAQCFAFTVWALALMNLMHGPAGDA